MCNDTQIRYLKAKRSFNPCRKTKNKKEAIESGTVTQRGFVLAPVSPEVLLTPYISLKCLCKYVKARIYQTMRRVTIELRLSHSPLGQKQKGRRSIIWTCCHSCSYMANHLCFVSVKVPMLEICYSSKSK